MTPSTHLLCNMASVMWLRTIQITRFKPFDGLHVFVLKYNTIISNIILLH